MYTYRQAPPYCVKIENTEGCNLKCTFCGINGIREKPGTYKYLTPEIAHSLTRQMKELGWNSRIEFAMHGEPTLNMQFEEILAAVRANLPTAHLMVETNGGGLAKNPLERIPALFNAGLNALAMDEYEETDLVPVIWDKLEAHPEIAAGLNARMIRYPSGGGDGNPHMRKPFRRIIRIAPINLATSGTHKAVHLSNHCGAGAPLNERAVGKRCARPFRELSMRWDGSFCLCCNDWRGELAIGNILQQSLDEIWQSQLMTSVRKKLYHGQRDFGPCNGCDSYSYRTGLLPNPTGTDTLPEPDAEDEEILKQALNRQPLTMPVRREWEQPVG